MKFKVLKGTPLFDQLTVIEKKIDSCNKATRLLVERLGFKQFYKKNFVLAGGFYGLIPLDGKTKPDGYSWAFNDRTGNAVMPAKRKANAEILAEIKALPTVEYDELNKVLNYDDSISRRPGSSHGVVTSFCPGVVWKKNFILVNVPVYSGKYKPPVGMVEILESEYTKLSK